MRKMTCEVYPSTRKSLWKDMQAGKIKRQQLCKVSSPSLDDHNFKEKDVDMVGEMSNVCSQIILTCLYSNL